MNDSTTTIDMLSKSLDKVEYSIEALDALISDTHGAVFYTHDLEKNFETDRGRKCYVDDYFGSIHYADTDEEVYEHEEYGEEPENLLTGSDAHVLSSEPLLDGENVWSYIDGDFILEFVAEVGHPYRATISLGGPNVFLVSEGNSNYRLEGYWGGESLVRRSAYISDFMDSLIHYYTEGLGR